MTWLPSARIWAAWVIGSLMPPTVPDLMPLPTPGSSPWTWLVCDRITIAFCPVKRTDCV